jgi:CheY-like chemotaxis protein
MELDPSAPLHADLLEIREAAERSANLTRQLLAFARKQTIAPVVVDLNAIVGATLTMLRRMIGEAIDLAWRPAASGWLVRVDPSQLNQVLTNLCVNARDAIADVGRITIETGTLVVDDACGSDRAGWRPGEYVVLAVSDDGSGMDEETLGKLFIDVTSGLGRGTTVRIYLPRYVDAGDQTARASSAGHRARRGHATILLVEDEAALMRLTKRLLEANGYTVIAASSPREAMQIAANHEGTIHLLITDVIMPEMNGADLASRLLARSPHIKCLFVSGYTADVIAHHGVLDAGVPFIQKPFSAVDLIAKVREALGSE